MNALSNVEIDAINCTGWSFVPTVTTGRGTAELHVVARVENPRKKIKHVSTLTDKKHWTYIPEEYENLCKKNLRAAKALSRLVYRYQPKEDGTPRLEAVRDDFYYWAMSYKAWGVDLNCTEEQAKYVFERLEEWGYVETRYIKSKASRGVTMTHVRLLIADGAASLNGYPDFEPAKVSIPIGENSLMATGENSLMIIGENSPVLYIKEVAKEGGKEEGKPPGDKSKPESTPESKSKPVDASLTTTHAFPETASGKSCVISQKPNQDKSKTESNPTPGSARPPLNSAPKQARTSSYVDDCYGAMREHHPDSFMPFKKAQRANLSSLAVRLHKSGRLQARGTDEHAFLQWVFGSGWFTCALEFEDYWSLENHERVPVKMWPDVQALFGAAGEANLKMAVNLFLNDLEQQQHA